MNTKGFLEQELSMELRKEGGQWRTRCPECQKLDGLSVSDDTGQYRCFGCDIKGNAYTLMKLATPYNNDRIWEILGNYGLDDVSESPTKKKRAAAAIKADGYRYATDDELSQLAEAKNVSIDALKKLGVLVDRKKPEIAVLPMHRQDLGRPTGGILVRLDGKPHHWLNKDDKDDDKWYFNPSDDLIKKLNLKPVKYPNLKGTSIGLLGSQWLKEENCNTIILVEGFKDMLAAIQAGYVAATFGGCGNFSEDCAWQFNGKIVYIVFDNDKAGQHHAPRQAERLYLYAKEVYIVPPWEEVAEKNGTDLHDYLVEVG